MKPMKPMKPMTPISEASEAATGWWPQELGHPGATGSSNELRYAYFAHEHRLAVDDGKHVTVYDTGDTVISGFSSSDGKTLTFDTEDGARTLSSLKRVRDAVDGATRPRKTKPS